MTHVPAESSAWPRAGADPRPSASGQQIDRPWGEPPPAHAGHPQGEHGSDLPAAARDPQDDRQPLPPFPEARQHEGRWSAQHAQTHHDEAYRDWREAHARALDDDYQAFRQERFRSEFEAWRLRRQSPSRDGSDAGEQRSDAAYEAQRPGAFAGLSPALPGTGTGSGDLGGMDSPTGSDPYGR